MSGLHCRKTHQFCFILFYSVLSCLINILFGYMPCFVLCCSDMFHSNSVLLSSDLSNSILFSSDLSFLLCSVPFSSYSILLSDFYYVFCSDHVLFWYSIQFHFILLWFVMFYSVLDWFALFFSILLISVLLLNEIMERNRSTTVWWLPFSSTVLYLEAAAGFNSKFWLLLTA